MTHLDRLAHSLGRRDEIPNQALARDLAQRRDAAGIREIVAGLTHKDKNIQADCIKVLYEVGAIDPALIAEYAADFLALLGSRNNRLVWGGMTALAAIAAVSAPTLYAQRQAIQRAVEIGSVITQDSGILALARIAVHSPKYRAELLPYLLAFLRNARAKDVPRHAEAIAPAVGAKHAVEFSAILEKHLVAMTASRASRVKRLLRNLPVRE
jgi:hypothetical protein